MNIFKTQGVQTKKHV